MLQFSYFCIKSLVRFHWRGCDPLGNAIKVWVKPIRVRRVTDRRQRYNVCLIRYYSSDGRNRLPTSLHDLNRPVFHANPPAIRDKCQRCTAHRIIRGSQITRFDNTSIEQCTAIDPDNDGYWPHDRLRVPRIVRRLKLHAPIETRLPLRLCFIITLLPVMHYD